MAVVNDKDHVPDAFVAAALQALAVTRFAAPKADQACVLLFDSATWATFGADSATLLDAAERARAARFRRDRDRITYTLAHAMWRLVLAACLERKPADVPLVCLSSGQPRLPGTGLATSLSHSGGWVAIAVACAAAVGVDIESTPATVALSGLSATICTVAEAAHLRELPLAEREPMLLALWTRKEALLKAYGIGLMQDPATIPVATFMPVAPPADLGLPPCVVRDLALPAHLVGALAVPAGVEIGQVYVLNRLS